MERDPDLFPVEVDELDEEPNHPSAFARHEHVPNRIELPEGCSEVILVDLLRAKIRDLALKFGHVSRVGLDLLRDLVQALGCPSRY